MKRILFLLLSLIVFSSFVFGLTPETNGTNYWNYTELTDYWGSITSTNNGATSVSDYPTFGISGNSSPNSFFFDGSDYIASGKTIVDTDPWTISIWIKPTIVDDAFRRVFDNGQMVFQIMDQTSFNNEFRFYGAGFDFRIGSAVADNWYHLVGTYDGVGEVNFYINGELNGTDNSVVISDSTVDFRIGSKRVSLDEYFIGNVDEVKVYDDELSLEQIENLYNCGSVDDECGVSSPFQISAKSFWDNSSINNFSAYIGGVGTFNTTNGTIITPLLQNDTNSYNITIFSNNWFNKTYLNNNVSNNLEGVLKQSEVLFYFQFSNGDLITTPINLTSINTTSFFNVAGGNETIFPNEGEQLFSVRCDNNVFAPFNFSIDITALDNVSYNFSVNETPTYLYFYDDNSSSPIDNASVNVYFPSGFSDNYVTNSLGSINFSYIQNNITEFGNYTFEFSKVGYNLINISEVINNSGVPFNKSYNISRAKLIVNVYNRDGHSLLSGVNVSVAMVGLFNETITSGTLTKDNLSIIGGEYTIYVGSDGYKTEQRTFTYTNQEELTINFYLLNLTNPNAGQLFVSTTDSFFRKITSASCELLEYSPTDLSFISVSECLTNINAECGFNIELNVKTYYIRCTSIIDDVLRIAETNQAGEIISVNNDFRNLIFFTRADFEVSVLDNLIYDIDESFVNNVSSISVDFESVDGTAIEVCIEYFRLDGGGWVSVTDDLYCLESSATLQNVGASVGLNRSNTYRADVYIKQTSNNIGLESFDYPNVLSASEVYDDLYKSVIVMVFWVFALGFAMHSRNINIWFYLAIILSWGELIVFPIFTVVIVSVFKTLISLATLFISRKKRDNT